ncbi:MAG: hypothetical protein E7672_05835 [Ruminococcaceae bacterium]|nr:hypothetical protein [Oscillospiraceae bacterium]
MKGKIKMKTFKISLIGAGSGCFSTGLVRDICKCKTLSGSLISLMDINTERLDAVHNLCERLNKELGGDLRFEKTTDRIESLKGADFVINTALTAPHERLREGWKIAEKYGFKLGGSYHVMYDEAFWLNFYQFRFMEELTLDIREHCPNAWHLMVSNPVVAGVTLLQRKYPDVKMVGLCHGYAMTYRIAELLGYSKEDITYQMPGVNHFVWLNEGRLKGEPIFDVLDRWLADDEKTSEFWANSGRGGPLGKKRMDFYKKHGVIGIGDTLSDGGASWPWWYHVDDETEKKFGEYTAMDGWNAYFEKVERRANNIIELSKQPDKSVEEFVGNISPDELMVPLIEAIAGDIPRVIIVNTLNKGQLVPGVPEDFEVEVPALCSADGIHPITTKPLPKHIIAHILRDRVAPVEMELEAYETGNLEFLKELVLMDKWATSMEQVTEFIDEIMALPYHEEMRKHYK